MNFKKILPILVTPLLLTACATSNNSSSSNSSSEDNFDLSFNGITIDNAYQGGCKIGGVLMDLSVGAWIVAGDVNVFTIEMNDMADQSFSVDIGDPSIAKYEKRETDGQVTHCLIGLKTGGTIIKIYNADGDLVYREALNCRVPIKDNKTIFDKLAEADYWYGAFSAAMKMEYRLLFSLDEESGLYSSCSLSMKEPGHDYGVSEFKINLDSATESHFDAFHTMDYTVTQINGAEIKPTIFAISLALDTIYISDELGVIDFFKPMYL